MGKVVTFVHSFDCSELLIVPTSHNQVLFLFPDKYIEENKLAFIRYKPLIKIILVISTSNAMQRSLFAIIRTWNRETGTPHPLQRYLFLNTGNRV